MELFRQGFGTNPATRRRVDIAKGIVVDADAERADTRRARRHGSGLAARGTTTSYTIAAALIVACVLVVLVLSGCAISASAGAVAPSIEIESVRLTAAGHYIDLRYRVLDADAANSSLGPGVKPLLIDEATGATMAVPTTAKLGSLRQTRGNQRPDRSYFVLFANTAGVKAGSVVTAQMGDMRFESLTIE